MLGVDYFFRIPHELAEAGAKVYVAQLSGTNSNEVRGEQLIRELKTIRAMSGNPSMQFNLIGHSQWLAHVALRRGGGARPGGLGHGGRRRQPWVEPL